MEKLIRLSQSIIGTAEIDAVTKVLENGYLGMGEVTRMFERELTSFLGVDAICTVNGTAAVHLALQAAGVGPGDEVIVPSLTYVATFQAITATGAKPIACDIEEESWCACPRSIETLISERTKAIVYVHYSGGVGNIDKVLQIANRNGLRVIEDAAHAFGTLHNGKRVGSFGDICCFSFDGIKNITSGEGGCVVSSDSAILEKVKDLRLLGVHNDSEERYSGGRSWEFNVSEQGWRYHMSDIMAAIDRVQLSRFAEIRYARQSLAEHYFSRLSKVDQIKILQLDYTKVVPHIFPIKLKNIQVRNSIREILFKNKVQFGFHYMANHKLDYFNTSLS